MSVVLESRGFERAGQFKAVAQAALDRVCEHSGLRAICRGGQVHVGIGDAEQEEPTVSSDLEQAAGEESTLCPIHAICGYRMKFRWP